MKAYKLEILVIDHDGLGAEEIQSVIENTKYPNWWINPDVKHIEERDIGEWEDSHPLNLRDECENEYRRLFSANG